MNQMDKLYGDLYQAGAYFTEIRDKRQYWRQGSPSMADFIDVTMSERVYVVSLNVEEVYLAMDIYDEAEYQEDYGYKTMTSGVQKRFNDYVASKGGEA